MSTRLGVMDSFNPRSRTGSDYHNNHWCELFMELQSTLPHGERPVCQIICGGCDGFNPRSRTGSDAATPPPSVKICKLQSTLPHGERRMPTASTSTCLLASIHAPARGATLTAHKAVEPHIASIHAPARGATSFCLIVVMSSLASIHAPARGATVTCFLR